MVGEQSMVTLSCFAIFKFKVTSNKKPKKKKRGLKLVAVLADFYPQMYFG